MSVGSWRSAEVEIVGFVFLAVRCRGAGTPIGDYGARSSGRGRVGRGDEDSESR